MNEHIEEARRLVETMNEWRHQNRFQFEYDELAIRIVQLNPQLLAHIDAQAAELTRLRSLLPTTADGVSIADCPELYCPHCGDKVLQYPACCVCENCGSDESGPMELEYSETVSKPKETERA